MRLASKVWNPVATMIVPTLICLISSTCLKSMAFFSPQASTQVFLHLSVSVPRLKLRQASGSISTTWGVVPCSTIKLVTALAALTEGVVSKNTTIYTSRYVSYNLTQALARFNNQYFNILGTRLGFDRVHHYAEMLGLGEKAGLDIPGEQPGILPLEAPKNGGVGMMTSFGTGISQTPLELAAMLGAIANGGTMYYLQYPRTQEDVDHFNPKVKH